MANPSAADRDPLTLEKGVTTTGTAIRNAGHAVLTTVKLGATVHASVRWFTINDCSNLRS